MKRNGGREHSSRKGLASLWPTDLLLGMRTGSSGRGPRSPTMTHLLSVGECNSEALTDPKMTGPFLGAEMLARVGVQPACLSPLETRSCVHSLCPESWLQQPPCLEYLFTSIILSATRNKIKPQPPSQLCLDLPFSVALGAIPEGCTGWETTQSKAGEPVALIYS